MAGVTLSSKALIDNINAQKMIYNISIEGKQVHVLSKTQKQLQLQLTSPSQVQTLPVILNQAIKMHVSRVTRGPKISPKPRKTLITKRSKNPNKRRNKAKNILSKIHEPLKVYFEKLQNEGWFKESNMKDKIPSIPSYSTIHALEESFKIVLWRCAHNHKLSRSFQVHHNSKIQFILSEKTGIIWHKE